MNEPNTLSKTCPGCDTVLTGAPTERVVLLKRRAVEPSISPSLGRTLFRICGECEFDVVSEATTERVPESQNEHPKWVALLDKLLQEDLSSVKLSRKESVLQYRLAAFLRGQGYDVVREHAVNDRLRLDLLVNGQIAIEVKVAGSPRDAWVQLQRYMECDAQFKAGILITTAGTGTERLPAQIETSIGVRPFHCVRLMGEF